MARDRQSRSRARWGGVAAGCAALVLVAGLQQVTSNGWQAFVFRGPGIGASGDAPDGAATAEPTKAPDTSAQPAPTITPVTPVTPVTPEAEQPQAVQPVQPQEPLLVMPAGPAVAPPAYRPPPPRRRHHPPPPPPPR